MGDRTVHKFVVDLHALDSESRFVVRLPYGSKVVHVGRQSPEESEITVWYEHYYGNHPEPATLAYDFYVYGTGHPITKDDRVEHVGSVVGPMFVWHLYQKMYRR